MDSRSFPLAFWYVKQFKKRPENICKLPFESLVATCSCFCPGKLHFRFRPRKKDDKLRLTCFQIGLPIYFAAEKWLLTLRFIASALSSERSQLILRSRLPGLAESWAEKAIFRKIVSEQERNSQKTCQRLMVK